jgi:RHS repeat-associated protein
VVYYLHGDHLGSTSLTTDQSGAIVSQARYLPYGQERWTDKASPTDFGFTSQRKDSYMELVDYGARWYDAGLGRFISPDTIIPNPVNPQSFNRYTYVYNNPVKYTDPNGHFPLAIVAVPALVIAVEATLLIGAVALINSEPFDEAAASLAQGMVEGGRKAATFVEETIINGSTETYPLGEQPDPYSIPGPTLGEIKVSPVLPGPPIAVEQPNTFGLGFPLERPGVIGDNVSQIGEYGTTPAGRPFTKHYATETGPKRNIPVSLVDSIIDNVQGIPIEGGKTAYYDSENNVTVITGDGGSIVSVRKGEPRKDQQP